MKLSVSKKIISVEKCLCVLSLILYSITDMGVNLIVDMGVGESVVHESCSQQESILLFTS